MDELHDALPPSWHAGRPFYHDEQRAWELYAYRTAGRAKQGKRADEWTATGATDAACVREMARYLRALGAGRFPE